MNKWLVFLNAEGQAIGHPIAVESSEEADGLLEDSPHGTAYQFISTKGEVLSGDYGLCEDDFDKSGG